jgi:hypothetical protein
LPPPTGVAEINNSAPIVFPETAMGRQPISASGKSLAAYKTPLMRLILVAAILSAGLFGVVRSYSGKGLPAAIGRKSDADAIAVAAQPSSDNRTQELIVGAWEDDYQGKRTLTVRPNGTATMVVEFDGWKARMFTPRLRIETTWTIDEGRFNRQTVGGEPADKVEFVKRRVGDRASDKIVKVTADRMVLIDQDGETRYNWRRVR